MEPTPELIDALYRERVHRSRTLTVAQRIQGGLESFALACEFMKAGNRAEHPGADESKVAEILRKRLALGCQLEDSD